MTERSTPSYHNLHSSQALLAAGRRMEARGSSTAHTQLIQQALAGLPAHGTFLEVGAATATMARQVATACPGWKVYASDQHEALLRMGAAWHAEAHGSPSPVTLFPWDITNPPPPAAPMADVIASCMMSVWIDPAAMRRALEHLQSVLRPGGRLLFLDQDQHTDSFFCGEPALTRRILARRGRSFPGVCGPALAALAEEVGLQVIKVEPLQWRADRVDSYVRLLVDRLARSQVANGDIHADEGARWLEAVDQADQAGTFRYCITYYALWLGQR